MVDFNFYWRAQRIISGRRVDFLEVIVSRVETFYDKTTALIRRDRGNGLFPAYSSAIDLILLRGQFHRILTGFIRVEYEFRAGERDSLFDSLRVRFCFRKFIYAEAPVKGLCCFYRGFSVFAVGQVDAVGFLIADLRVFVQQCGVANLHHIVGMDDSVFKMNLKSTGSIFFSFLLSGQNSISACKRRFGIVDIYTYFFFQKCQSCTHRIMEYIIARIAICRGNHALIKYFISDLGIILLSPASGAVFLYFLRHDGLFVFFFDDGLRIRGVDRAQSAET